MRSLAKLKYKIKFLTPPYYIGNPTLTELAFCETSKGGLMMLEGDFSFSKHRVTGDVTQWHCVQRGYCKARLHNKEMK